MNEFRAWKQTLQVGKWENKIARFLANMDGN